MKIIINNLATEYRDEGEGPVILMLHGWWRDLSDFDLISKELKNEFRIIRLDFPGFGGTEMPKRTWSVFDYVDFIKSFIEKLEIQPEVLLGHSFGGRVILKGVGTNVLSAEKLVLISPAGLKTNGLRKMFFMFLAKIGDIVSYIPPLLFVRNKLKNKFYKFLGSDYLESGHMREIFKVVINEDLSPYAEKIELKTLLIWGESDVQTPVSEGKILSSLIKNSELCIIKNTGHFSFIEKFSETVLKIKDFLR